MSCCTFFTFSRFFLSFNFLLFIFIFYTYLRLKLHYLAVNVMKFCTSKLFDGWNGQKKMRYLLFSVVSVKSGIWGIKLNASAFLAIILFSLRRGFESHQKLNYFHLKNCP
jgi:hypothetical protein